MVDRADEIEEHSPEPAPTLARAIAEAPGALPMSKVEERFLAHERQFRHDNTIEPLAPRPGEPVSVTAVAGARMRLDAATIFYTVDGSFPDSTAPRIPMKVASVEWDERVGYLTRWQEEIPAQPAGTLVRYRIGGRRFNPSGSRSVHPDVWAHDGQGFWFKFPGEQGITTFAYLVEAPASPMPGWMRDAVIYHIFLDRFHPGTPDGHWPGNEEPRGRHGGTLAGVLQAMPYVAELGVNCLWLSPLHPSETFHRYDTIDYFDVDPALGTRDELQALIAEAHERGMRVVLDFVPSHCSWRHPAFVSAQQDSMSPTRSWFTFDEWPDRYRSFMQRAKYLPSFNTDDPEARAHLIESATFWMRDLGVDGYRLDHAIAPSMDFWIAFRRATEAISTEVVNIGEATDTPDCLRRYRGKLHGILDFELAAALRLSFGTGDWSLATLDTFLEDYDRFMADGPGRVSFLDNHDMDRFLWVAGNDVERLKLAALCLFTLAPTPVLFYGTEIGMSQNHGSRQIGFGGDAEARHDMPWDERLWNHDLLSLFRRLVRLRRDHSALTGGARETIHLDESASVWAYARRSEPPAQAQCLVVVFNAGDNAATIGIPQMSGTPQVLLTTGDSPQTDARSAAIIVPPTTGVVIEL